MPRSPKKQVASRTAPSYVKRLESLIEAAKRLNSTFDLDELLRLILELATDNLRADRGTIYLVDEEHQTLWSKVLKGSGIVDVRLPLGTGIAGTVAVTSETVNLKDARKDERFFSGFDRQSGFVTRTMLCMPMKNRDGNTIGVFQIINKKRGVFDRQDELFLEAFSEHAAVAIENARLYRATLESERVGKEIAIASEMQQRLLPKQIPRIPGYSIAAEAHPCNAIGGDFYDIVNTGEGRFAFVMADVAGKGIPAAMLVSTLHASLRVHLQNPKGLSERQRLSDLTAKLNTLVYENSPSDKFITFFIMILDPLTHRLTYVNAGHNAPYMHAPGAAGFRELAATGVPLGLLESTEYESEEIPVSAGESILLYTDGITEAMNRSKEQFGEERLKEMLAGSIDEGVQAVRDRVVAAVKRFQGKEPASDDLTLLILQRTE